MNNITLVTAPDDIHIDAVRILTYDLDNDQSQLVSNALTSMDNLYDTVMYIAKSNDDPQWILDKKIKSSIIILNAESDNQTLVGYLAAQPGSYYFGTIKTIGQAKTNILRNVDDVIKMMEENTTKHARI